MTPKSLVIAMPQNTNVENYDTNHMTLLIEENMNVDLEFQLLPANSSEAQTKVALLITSGLELPDVFCMSMSAAQILDYSAKGIFVKLNDYFSNPDLCVNFMKIDAEDREFMLKSVSQSDESIYTMPKYAPVSWNMGAYRCWVNSSWLTKLNLEAPKTTDELTEVLRAMVNGDPNGNNKKDEVGIVGSNNGWAQKPFVYLMNSFIYADYDKNFFMVSKDKISVSYVTPEWKSGLEYMAMLINEGLFSPLSFTQDDTQLKALIDVEGDAAGFVAAGSASVFTTVERKYTYVLAEPVAGPDGVSYTPYSPTIPSASYFITKDCEDPEFAFRVGDYFYDYLISTTNRFGELGVDWTDDPAICEQWMGQYEESNGIKPTLAILNASVWGNPQNKLWGDVGPGYRSLESHMRYAKYKKSDGAASQAPDSDPVYFQLYVSHYPKEYITQLSYTIDELELIATIKTTIDSYVYETAIAFVTGNKPLTQWDDYLAELEKMGLQKYIDATQNAYNRVK
jgi:putative aldouronate transport system substrate-binding protein